MCSAMAIGLGILAAGAGLAIGVLATVFAWAVFG